jgi:AcrR family transcriptional regulator
VATEGTEGLTLRGAARLAGVSQAAPYRHFRNKEALLAAVAEDGFRAMAATMREATATSDDPLARFRARGLAYVRFATSHPSHFRVMFGRELADRTAYPSLQEAAAETYRMLVTAVEDGQRAGLLRDVPPEELALLAWSGMHGLASLLVDGQLPARAAKAPTVLADKSPAELAEIVGRNLFLGLGPR